MAIHLVIPFPPPITRISPFISTACSSRTHLLLHSFKSIISISPHIPNAPKPPQNPKSPIRARQTTSHEVPTGEAPSTPRRRGGRKKSDSSSKSTDTKLKTPSANGPIQPAPASHDPAELESDGEDYDDGMDFPYADPPLVCCFGAAQKEFVPTVRVSEVRVDPDVYSEWKQMQWVPPEFARAPGGPSSNVAISHVRLGGRAAFMGKVGLDDLGEAMVHLMNKERVQTRAVKFDRDSRTACAKMRIWFDDGGRLRCEVVKESAEDSLLSSELNLAVLKEARMFHFNSEALTSPSMHAPLFRAIKLSKKFGGQIFFDVNLPLPLWKSRDATLEVIGRAWKEANIIEVTIQELEFLLDEAHYERKRNYQPQYYSENYDQVESLKEYHYHYTREELAPLWHEGLKFLFVTDGTFRIHYYSQEFDGFVFGTEDTMITPFTCDRTGSGDAMVAAIMRKLTSCPEMYENVVELERQLRVAVCAGIISQWTIGAVRGFPTESAAHNLKEQIYVPSRW